MRGSLTEKARDYNAGSGARLPLTTTEYRSMKPWIRWVLLGLFITSLLIIQFIPATGSP